MNSGFLDKLLERLGRVRPEELRDYVHRLADQKGFFETIFDALHEGVIVTDPDGTITYLNRTACDFFGIDRESAMGHPLTERLRGLDWNAIAEAEKTVSRDMEIFYPQNRFLNFYVAPLRVDKATAKLGKSPEQELIGYAVILRDITETRKSTEETIQSERLNALTMLAAGVAHEVGNPLNSLNIQLQLLGRRLRKLPADQRKDLLKSVDVAKEEISRLDTIIRQFLGAIRPARLERHLENINQLVQESVRFLNAETTDRNIIVQTELRADLPLLEVDRTQMKQAFFNVIRNAFQAMKSGGILRIRTDADDRFVSITFADTGGGIPDVEMSKIFEPYFTTKVSGTGLGLLIVRRIVREHGGEIELLNDFGKGLSLTMKLPLGSQRVRMLPGPPSGESTPLRTQ
jgi:two-component system, sporulation sensor kinase E